jgi:hypothetical protein
VERPEEGLSRIRLAAAVRVCVGWLWAAVLLDAVVGLVCLISAWAGSPLEDSPEPVVVLPLTALLLFVPLVWVAVGADALQRQASLGRAYTAAAGALFVGAVTIVPTVAAAWGFLGALRTESMERWFLLLAVLGVSLGGTLCAFLGGARALTLLARPDVRRAFREHDR